MGRMRWPLALGALVLVGACGDDGNNAQSDAAVDSEVMIDAATMPATLAETGLCVDAGCTQIATGIYPYKPRFELWSDSATKKRWIYLPPGTSIDTTNMDQWSVPVGTKLWKEFTRGTTRVETRLEMRIGPGDTQQDWLYAAYVWNATQDAATWAEFGEMNANGTQHDVPSKILCRTCHENNKPSRVLGFSAIQLDYTGAAGDIDLADAITNNWLSAPPTAPGSGPYFPFPVADSSYEYPALGYMHANCGHCHNPNSNVAANTDVTLRLTVGSLGSLATTSPYMTAVDKTTANTVNGHTYVVKPGMPNMSVLIDRFEAVTTPSLHMPAAGTEDLDTVGQAILRDWVTNIP